MLSTENPQPPLAIMSLLSLRFTDPELEDQIKSRQISSTQQVLVLMAFIMFFFAQVAGMQASATVVMLIHFTIAITLMRCGKQLLNYSNAEVHGLIGMVFEVSWGLAVLPYWWQIWNGTLTRLQPDETEKMVGCCCLWVVAMIVPCVLHLSMRHCFLFYAHALAVVITSPHWQRHLLLAIMLGYGIGYIFERMLRGAFLDRAQDLEQLRREKERMAYDMMMAEHRSATRSATTRSRRGTSPVRSRSSTSSTRQQRRAVFEADRSSTCGTNSELDGFGESDKGSDVGSHCPETRSGAGDRSASGLVSSPRLRSDRLATHSPRLASQRPANPRPGSPARRRQDVLWTTLANCGIKPHDD